MAVHYGNRIVTSDLLTAIDFASRRSTEGTGTSTQGSSGIRLNDLSVLNNFFTAFNIVSLTSTHADNTGGNNGYFHSNRADIYKWGTDTLNGNNNPSLTFEVAFRTTDGSGLVISRPWNGSGQYNYGAGMSSWFVQTGNSSSSINFPIGLNDNVNKHLVVWANGTQIGYYINGGTAAGGFQGVQNHGLANLNGASAGDANLPLAIGTLYPYGSNWGGVDGHHIKGIYHFFRVYKRVLTAQEVLQNFSATKNRLGI